MIGLKCHTQLSHSANCGPPNQPLNGYILPYSSTIEGTMVTILCWNNEQRSIRMKGNLTCNHHGVWEPNPSEVCGTELVSGNKIYLIAIDIGYVITC